MVDLNTLIPPGLGMQLTLAKAINDRGEIAVNGTPSGCGVVEQCGYAVLLIPCDDDHANVEGCHYSIVDAADVSNNAATPQSPLAVPPTMDSLTRTINPLRIGLGSVIESSANGPRSAISTAHR